MENNTINTSDIVATAKVEVGGLDELRGLLDRLEAIKPGYKTTEFWVSLAILGVNIALTFGFLTSGEANQLIAAALVLANALVTIGYAYSRGKAKGLN